MASTALYFDVSCKSGGLYDIRWFGFSGTVGSVSEHLPFLHNSINSVPKPIFSSDPL